MLHFELPFNLVTDCESLNLETIGRKVKNRVIFSNEDFLIMAILGPNNRSDYHINSKQVCTKATNVLIMSLCRNSFIRSKDNFS